ncbi:efflux RND transporter permease subunit [Oceanicoccus sp. KOV_DT_Chl]|uniref:efflux RND transporter permease subunit n=1 Tax=Oceanicoccus sp. KOV_DT_Chl TaxID=1904639 RepID=UPI00190EBB88|nr:efflux RND transporter permease subunit [Oceanicoccus sp. KOV_DT_Chl]
MNSLLTNPRAFALIIALIIVAGLAALNDLPRNEDPRPANRHAIVMTEFPGASAERVEALVTEPLENLIREMPEVSHIDSRSSAGFSSMSVTLVDEVARSQTEAVWSELRDKLEKSQSMLPVEASKPLAEERRSYPFTTIVALTWAHVDTEPDVMILGRYAEELESRVRRLPGIDFVDIQGQPREEIVVAVDSGRAAALGLAPHYIGEQVYRADAKNTAGEIHNSHMRVAVEVEGALDSLERIRRIPLRQMADGSAILLGDVAQIKRQPKLPHSEIAIVNGRAAVTIGVRMQPDQRSDLWSLAVQAELEAFRQRLPANVALEVIFDQERYTTARLSELIGNIIIGFCLIVVVLLVTLGWRSAIVVAAALPLTVLFALACMNFTGLPIHQMSVTGLIVALGIMVDNAIVMTDTVNRKKQEGMSGLQATQYAVKHLWLPLLGSTLTTMLAFMPIIVMPGSASEFVGAIGITVIFSLLGSYLISHCIVAGLAGRFLTKHRRTGWWQDGLDAPQLSEKFKASINWGWRDHYRYCC